MMATRIFAAAKLLLTCCLLLFIFVDFTDGLDKGTSKSARPNILIVTVDDMSCDSVGAFGCKLAGTTPNIDQLAAKGMRYHLAHVQVGNCYPSRNVMFSGRYPHNTGVEGFYQVNQPKHQHLVDTMKAGGYFVAIRGKVSHSTPYQPYAWDSDLTIIDGKKQDVKNAQSYYDSTKLGIELAKAADKPFCLNVNISDPHKPFVKVNKAGELTDKNEPSHLYKPSEVPIPGFLFDHPDIRFELAQYYSSVRRADDCFAAIMKALEESGQQENTVVMFLSDHGMPLPFAKTALWHHSTRTPWIVCWPGVTKAGHIDKQHMVSAVDLMPTVLDIAGIAHPEGFDGKSFLPTIRGESQPNCEMVYKVYNENSGGNRSPMRGVQSKKFGYLFNPWSDGVRVFKTATTGTMSYRAMKEVAKSDEKVAARLKFFNHGVPEEFYDYENDPDALNNLIDDPAYANQIESHRKAMRKFMVDSNDPILGAFDQREDAAARSAYVDKVQSESDERRKNRRKNKRAKPNNKKAKQGAAKGKYKNLFKFDFPESASKGEDLSFSIDHKLPSELGEQKFHITLKDSSGKRVERIIKAASGEGSFEASFKIPADFESNNVTVAIFVGEDYASNLLHKSQGPISVD